MLIFKYLCKCIIPSAARWSGFTFNSSRFTFGFSFAVKEKNWTWISKKRSPSLWAPLKGQMSFTVYLIRQMRQHFVFSDNSECDLWHDKHIYNVQSFVLKNTTLGKLTNIMVLKIWLAWWSSCFCPNFIRDHEQNTFILKKKCFVSNFAVDHFHMQPPDRCTQL